MKITESAAPSFPEEKINLAIEKVMGIKMRNIAHNNLPHLASKHPCCF